MFERIRAAVCAAALIGLTACGGGGGGGGGSPPVAPPPPPPPPVLKPFVDVTAASGIAYSVGITPRPGAKSLVEAVTVGGAAAGDCDGDGDIDLFITSGDASGGVNLANRLYINQLYLDRSGTRGTPLRFVDTAVTAGVAYTRNPVLMQNNRHSGPTFADMDGDGDLDLFIGGLFGDPPRIYANNGNCVFTDVTSQSPEIQNLEAAHTISAAFGDYDLDGDLDMFLSHWGTDDDTYQAYLPAWHTEHLWENRPAAPGDITFVNVSGPTNVSDVTRTTRQFPDPTGTVQQIVDFTFTPTFARMDADPWPDIAIAADFGTTQLLLSNGDGTFRDSGLRNLLSQASYGMGSAIGDIDDDGDLDWFVSSIFGTAPALSGNRLFMNLENGTGTFDLTDNSFFGGIHIGGWGWGSCFLDLDNDRDLDIYQTNGWPYEFLGEFFEGDQTAVFVRDGGSYSHREIELGLDDTWSARGVVCADFDDDGDVDILQLTNRQGQAGVLWENRSAAAGRNWLKIRLQGLAPNTEASGARIYVTVGGVTQMREIMIGSNFISQNPAVQHFGLGATTIVDSIRIQWPAQTQGPGQPPLQPPDTVLPDATTPVISANQLLVISQGP